MSVSFIITSYNIENYIVECLESVAACTRTGDEIIIVDDGSTDATTAKVRAFVASAALPEDITLHPVFLGANTFGGVGIAANIGMDHASKDIVFFVDGDDWLNPETFNPCRDVFKARGGDFMLVNYREFDERANKYKTPADQARWANVQKGLDKQARLELALSFIAVPWRKFYRRQFLQESRLRFPEGDFFFEDNPFHWAVCRAAQGFSFYDQVICYHRTNRPGQTMGSTGMELLAFFTHYESIRDAIAATEDQLHLAAMRWLINNMSWHLGRLHPNVQRLWGQRAMACLQDFPEDLWQEGIAPEFLGAAIGDVCEQLRGRNLQGFLSGQQIGRLGQQINNLGHRVNGLHTDLRKLQREVQNTKQFAQSTRNIQEYTALLALHKKT
ncbi:MAG: glycosyltransferase [Rhodobacteraceae bacterium]|nr:glycosyltransferase [Paracoccaceae bacterium]